jgi:hypothetical protein
MPPASPVPPQQGCTARAFRRFAGRRQLRRRFPPLETAVRCLPPLAAMGVEGGGCSASAGEEGLACPFASMLIGACDHLHVPLPPRSGISIQLRIRVMPHLACSLGLASFNSSLRLSCFRPSDWERSFHCAGSGADHHGHVFCLRLVFSGLSARSRSVSTAVIKFAGGGGDPAAHLMRVTAAQHLYRAALCRGRYQALHVQRYTCNDAHSTN